MNKTNILFALAFIGSKGYSQGFSNSATNFNIPAYMDGKHWMLNEPAGRRSLVDMNGDGRPDIVDTEDENTATADDVFKNGNQPYWKVYLNTGSGFSSSASNFNIPTYMDGKPWLLNEPAGRRSLVDMNGDGRPDIVDSEDENTATVDDVFKNVSQPYWKVYLNTGSGFSSSATNFNIPDYMDGKPWLLNEPAGRRSLVDMDGDGKPDIVDTEDENTATVDDVFKSGSQPYWKVYLNTGSGFNGTATYYNIHTNMDGKPWLLNEPAGRRSLVDMNGDGKPDIVDSEDENTATADDVFKNGSQPFWKVFLNTGSGFSTPNNFNIPAYMDGKPWLLNEPAGRRSLVDMNGDGKPEIVDTEDENTATVDDVFKKGNQQYWKVYLNTGSGFGSSATNFNIPAYMDGKPWLLNEPAGRRSLVEMNGDGKPDIVDSEDENTATADDVFKNGSQQYWKVYLNTSSVGFAETFFYTNEILVYPNPFTDRININMEWAQPNVSYSLVDNLGRSVLAGRFSDASYQLDLSKLTSGFYLLQLNGAMFLQTIRLVKH